MVYWSQEIEDMKQYPFSRVREKCEEVEKRDGIDIISLRIGIPDRGAPQFFKNAMKDALDGLTPEEAGLVDPSPNDPRLDSTFGYPVDVRPSRGMDILTDAIVARENERYGTDIGPENVLVTDYTKLILSKIPKLWGKGRVLVPSPGYPVFDSGPYLAGHIVEDVSTSEESEWLPNFNFKKGKVAIIVCDPNNPTSAVADEEFYQDVASKVEKADISGMFDAAYQEVILDENTKNYSMTQFPELTEHCFKIASFSKSHNFTGVGGGVVISGKKNIERLAKYLGHSLQGVPAYKQVAMAKMLMSSEVDNVMADYRQILRERGELLSKGLNELGLPTQAPRATPYLLARCGGDDEAFAFRMIGEAHVAPLPLSYLGPKDGRGWVRFTEYATKENIQESLRRIEEAGIVN